MIFQTIPPTGSFCARAILSKDVSYWPEPGLSPVVAQEMDALLCKGGFRPEV